MIIVKTPKQKISKTKIYKFSLRTSIVPENIDLLNGSDIKKIPDAKKMVDDKIEELNKRLERCRLISRAIEAASNRNMKEISTQLNQEKVNRTKGYYIESINSDNGIFIH